LFSLPPQFCVLPFTGALALQSVERSAVPEIDALADAACFTPFIDQGRGTSAVGDSFSQDVMAMISRQYIKFFFMLFLFRSE
jgi:hypothetical protein